MYTEAPELGHSAFLKLRCEEEESRRQSLVRGAFVDSCSSDGIMSALALTRFCNENVRFILLPYPGLEPHQPVQDYCHRQPASLQLLVLILSPISCSWPSPGQFSYLLLLWLLCFISQPVNESKHSEVQTGFLLSAYNFALTVTSSQCMPFHSEK